MKRLTTITKETRADFFEQAYNGSYYTITGCGGDLKDWIDGFDALTAERSIGSISHFYAFNGSDINEHYGLTGKNAYKPSLIFLAFPLDGLAIGKLVSLKLQQRDRWFDDIVDNNQWRKEVFAL